MSSATFSASVGGDGSTVTDDNDPSTGLGNGGHRLRFVPALAQVVAVAQYIIAVATGLPNAVWAPCRLMTVANDTLSGLAARDGVTPVAGDRVFVNAQTTPSQNGPYIAAAGAWSRAPDANISAAFVADKAIAVSEGTTGSNTMWLLTTNAPIVLNTTALTFERLPSLSKANIYAAAQTMNAGLTVAGAPLAMSAQPINEAIAVTIASAATVNLDNAAANLVDISGTTTITALTLANGSERTLRFTGALTLTNGASLVLPGAANITTAAGDFALVRGYASGVVRVVGYFLAGALPFLRTGGTITGALIMSGAAINTVQGSDIASAATTNLDNATGNTVNISGTATITAVTLTSGRERWVRATGAFTLTHGASLQVLPYQQSVTVGAGDVLHFLSLNSVIYVQHFPLNAGSPYLATGNLNTSGDTTITMPAGTWRELEIGIVGADLAANYAAWIQINADTGSNYNSQQWRSDSGTTTQVANALAAAIPVTFTGLLHAATSGGTPSKIPFECLMKFLSPSQANYFKSMTSEIPWWKYSGGSNIGHMRTWADWVNATPAAITSIKLMFRDTAGAAPSGTSLFPSAGTWYIKGLK